MKKTTPIAVRVVRPRRLGVAEAKTRLSEVLRQAADGPITIHSRGRDVAVLIAVEEYERLAANPGAVSGGGAQFLDRIEALKQRHGGGADFEPTSLELTPVDPFARNSRTRP